VASFAGEVTKGVGDGDADGEGVGVVAQPISVPASNRASNEKLSNLGKRYCFMSYSLSFNLCESPID